MRAVVLLVFGLAAGMVGGMLQTYVVRTGTAVIPVGAIAVLIALVLMVRAASWWVESRWGGALFSAAWLAMTVLLATQTARGDLVINDGTRQAIYLLAGSMLLATASGFPLLPERDSVRAQPSGGPADPTRGTVATPDDES